MTVYSSALAATSPEQFTALRSNMERHQPENVELSPLATAILAWAEREPITLSQATMVAKRFGVAIEEIVRGREVVDQRLEPISKSPEEANEAGELNKAQEILGTVPGEEALDEPAAHIAG
jgi:hypothetical protein